MIPPRAGWQAAVAALAVWEPGMRWDAGSPGRHGKVDQQVGRAAVQHWSRLASALASLSRRPARGLVRGVLLAAGAEMLGTPGRAPAIVHFAVEQARSLVSPREVAFLNAVLRRLPEALERTAGDPVTPEGAAAFYSHPPWLVRRWWERFGSASARALLAWNQAAPVTYLRVDAGPPPLDLVEPSDYVGFYRVRPSVDWSRLEEGLHDGRWTVQNPAQRLAVDLLALRPGESVLEVCAAPGGKSRRIAASLGPHGGPLVCVDLPGPRLDALRVALEPLRRGWIHVVGLDARTLSPRALAEAGLPDQYDAVLVDAPCSNTGVLQRKPDVKWRLREDEFALHASRQLAILNAAAGCVRPSGRLVYATCSLEREENADVAGSFLRAAPAWELRQQQISLPWETGVDGGAAFLLAPRLGRPGVMTGTSSVCPAVST